MTYIRLDRLRQQYKPQFPQILKSNYVIEQTTFNYPEDDATQVKQQFPNTFGLPLITFSPNEQNTINKSLQLLESNKNNNPTNRKHKPMNVGVVLSGGQAPGGHNVITGIFDALKWHCPSCKLFGFKMGPGGLLKGDYLELTSDVIDRFRNSGGFDMIGSDRTKLTTTEQFDKVLEVAKNLQLTALVIIGGDDSNTNAALLAEYAISVGSNLQVIGCPKTIDGDLKNKYIEASFGFDTCVKVYAELVGNIQRDCFSAKKYYHFIKLMGRSASHITLECALMCQPTMAIISEEIKSKKVELDKLITQIADVIVLRHNKGLTFGTVLIPEGLIEFIPGIDNLIAELNRLPLGKIHNIPSKHFEYTEGSHHKEFEKQKPNEPDEQERVKQIASQLSYDNAKLFLMLPTNIAISLSTERDPHGNVQVSKIPTEQLIADLVSKKLEQYKLQGLYDGKFSVLTHFFGYEGRSSMPSNFDASYCYSLGRCAVELIANGKTGYMATIRDLVLHPTDWKPTGLPLTWMIDFEERRGKLTPVIGKAIVNLNGEPMRYFRKHRHEWAENVAFRYPGPIQFFGPSAICDNTTITLRLEQGLTAYEDYRY